MRTNGSFALCVAALVAFVASAASACAFDSFSVISNHNAVASDDSFFPGQALTLGKLDPVSKYASSETASSYADCFGCSGSVSTVYYSGVTYYDSYVWDTGYYYYSRPTPVRNLVCPIVNFVDRVRPVRRVIQGVRGLFANDFCYCRPAYVCDPCWTYDVCDPCPPISYNVCPPTGIPSAIVPTSVYAPGVCCGYGYYPGEVNELDPETGLAKKSQGIPSQVDPAPQKLSNQTISTDDGDDLDPNGPATIPQYDSDDSLYDSNDSGLLQDDSYPEQIPTPMPDSNLNTGVIRMLVPEDSVVYVNGYRTKQKGEIRSFAARELEEGQTYSFEIRVVAMRDGRLYEDVKTTTLTAGESSSLAFNLKLVGSETLALNR